MANTQSTSESQDEIRNAANRVVVVAARFALNEYLKYSAYICQPNRSFANIRRASVTFPLVLSFLVRPPTRPLALAAAHPAFVLATEVALKFCQHSHQMENKLATRRSIRRHFPLYPLTISLLSTTS